MEKIDDPLQNDFGTLSQKTGLKIILIINVLSSESETDQCSEN